jgi:HEAT repeat protein
MCDVLTEDERQQVLDAHRRWGFLPARVVEQLQEQGAAEMPLDLIARAAVEDPNPSVRWRSLDLLDHYGDDEQMPAIIAATRDPIARVRRHAVHALACTDCKRTLTCVDAVPALRERALTDDNVKVRRHAVWALWVRRDDARAAAALDEVRATDPNAIVRAHATGRVHAATAADADQSAEPASRR